MTQERINKYFLTGLGQQCLELFTAPDDTVHIRYSDCVQYCKDKGLDETKIQQWFDENKY